MRNVLLATLLLFSIPAWAELPPPETQQAVKPEIYHYANNAAEYSIGLPEAPSVVTIWSNDKDIPYLEEITDRGVLGERAYFKRVEAYTDEKFDVEIIFLKADKEFLDTLTEEKVTNILKEEFKGKSLGNRDISHAAGADPDLRRTSFTAFTVDRNNTPLYLATHFMTGKHSILVVKVAYSLENKKYGKYYKDLISNINYLSE